MQWQWQPSPLFLRIPLVTRPPSLSPSPGRSVHCSHSVCIIIEMDRKKNIRLLQPFSFLWPEEKKDKSKTLLLIENVHRNNIAEYLWIMKKKYPVPNRKYTTLQYYSQGRIWNMKAAVIKRIFEDAHAHGPFVRVSSHTPLPSQSLYLHTKRRKTRRE